MQAKNSLLKILENLTYKGFVKSENDKKNFTNLQANSCTFTSA